MDNFDKEKFVELMNTQGYCIVQNVLDNAFVTETKKQLEVAIQKEVTFHKTKDYSDYGMVLLCSLYGGNFVSLFDNEVINLAFNSILGEGSIVYAYTSSSMPPNKSNFSNRIHVDCPRVIPEYITNMGATILLDDFTEENGATWFLPFSQKMLEKPEEEQFYKNGKRVIAKAGSVWFFNARIWHAGGNNLTNQWRHALTINMCRSYMKQRMDIPKMMGKIDLSNYSEQALQKLGFHTQIPTSYEEYYASPENRKYKQKAE